MKQDSHPLDVEEGMHKVLHKQNEHAGEVLGTKHAAQAQWFLVTSCLVPGWLLTPPVSLG